MFMCIYCKKNYGIPGFFVSNLSDTGKNLHRPGIFCAIQRKEFLSLWGKSVPVTAGVIFFWLGDVYFPIGAIQNWDCEQLDQYSKKKKNRVLMGYQVEMTVDLLLGVSFKL